MATLTAKPAPVLHKPPRHAAKPGTVNTGRAAARIAMPDLIAAAARAPGLDMPPCSQVAIGAAAAVLARATLMSLGFHECEPSVEGGIALTVRLGGDGYAMVECLNTGEVGILIRPVSPGEKMRVYGYGAGDNPGLDGALGEIAALIVRA